MECGRMNGRDGSSVLGIWWLSSRMMWSGPEKGNAQYRRNWVCRVKHLAIPPRVGIDAAAVCVVPGRSLT